MNREPKKENDLFFVCSLIEYIARKTKNEKRYVVEKLGKENIQKMYELADIYHCENIEKVADEFIEKSNLEKGNYNHLKNCKYNIPTYWDIGKVYKRLILMVSKENKLDIIDNLINVLSSWIIEKIDNYNSNMYYEVPEYIFECYKNGRIL